MKFLRFNTIRKKMLIYSLLIIVISIITSFYTINNSGHVINNFDSMFVSNVHLTELSTKLDNIDKELLNYLSTENSDSLDLYVKNSDDLSSDSYSMMKLDYNNNQLMLTDIGNMIIIYLKEADAAIKAKRGRNINECNTRYNRAKEISNNISYYIKQLNFNQFSETAQKYTFMSGKIKTLQFINLAIILWNLLFSIFIILWFTSKISVPIVSLAASAGEISRGNFEVENVKVNTEDEIKVMADAFNTMKDNIKTYIEEVKSQAEMEARLMDEKMQNLKMKSLLKTSEIQALQSQINPHFLFNTLNAGVQLAMMEDAEKTGLFLEKMSNLFRYNLRKIGKPVTLMEEINNLYTYIYILETRFGDLIKFIFDINVEEEAEDILMPAMIIQPLIENACIHGVGEMEGNGEIRLSVNKCGDYIEIIVGDNGKGMDIMTIEKIMDLDNDSEKSKVSSKTGHTTGIGLNNVHKRLNVFYESEDIFFVESEINKGTKIILKLPYLIGGVENV
jgi:two-component system, sensor histidine kinase YesM